MFKRRKFNELKNVSYGEIHYKCDENDDFTKLRGTILGLINGLSNIVGGLLNAGVPESLIESIVDKEFDYYKSKNKKSNHELEFDGDIEEAIKKILDKDE